MIEMTEARYNKLAKELVTVKRKLEQSLIEQAEAQAKGDLSENAEYETAKNHSDNLAKRKVEIEEELNEAVIVEVDNSPRITIGSVIDVCRVDESGNPIEEPRRFTLDAKGDTVIQGILGINSTLGKAIINGTSGIYRIVSNGGVSYSVKKVMQ